MPHARPRVAVDIGGTFTDLVLVGEGPPRIAKVATTPGALEDAVVLAMTLARTPADAAFVHGSTVVVNAVLERKGARVGLVASQGFRDVIFIGRTERRDIYDLRYRKPEPFLRRRQVVEIAGRIGPDGDERAALDTGDLDRVAEALVAMGAQSVAVSLHNAYADPAHERRVRDGLQARLAGIPVTLGSDLSREWREYERTQTAVLCAFVRPVVEGYLGRLEARLDGAGHRGPRALLHSAGGTVDLEGGRTNPIQLVESGPAGGVIGAQALGAMLGIADLVTIDVGGTTAKTARVAGGVVAMKGDYAIERTATSPGYPLQVPSVDLVEIGAGGGSIVALGAEGDVRVGPTSAGARPGPACYGLGGEAPTVTDVLLLAGRIAPGVFLGGALSLDASLAARALSPLADALGVDLEMAAVGALRVAQSRMAQALHLMTVARGDDPRDSVLFAIGGGGPVHGAELATLMGMRRVLVPPLPGVFSAWGMAIAPPRADLARTLVLAWPDGAVQAGAAARALGQDAVARLERQGVDRARTEVALQLDLRYRGQEHAVTVAAPDPADGAAVAAAFGAAHARLYGFSLADAALEMVAVRASAVGPAPDRTLPILAEQEGEALPTGRRRAYFEALGWSEVALYARAGLLAGATLAGPALIEEDTTTVSLPPQWRLRVGRYGELHLETDLAAPPAARGEGGAS